MITLSESEPYRTVIDAEMYGKNCGNFSVDTSENENKFLINLLVTRI